MASEKAEQWRMAMQGEMDSMYSSEVWELAESNESVKPIRCKWVTGKVERYKARSVVKGYTQREG